MNIVIIEGLSDRSTHDLIIESHHRLLLYAPHQRVSPSPFSDHFMRKKPVTAPSVRSFPLYLQN